MRGGQGRAWGARKPEVADNAATWPTAPARHACAQPFPSADTLYGTSTGLQRGVQLGGVRAERRTERLLGLGVLGLGLVQRRGGLPARGRELGLEALRAQPVRAVAGLVRRELAPHGRAQLGFGAGGGCLRRGQRDAAGLRGVRRRDPGEGVEGRRGEGVKG